MWLYTCLFIFGMLVGTLSGLFGIGGGIVLVPGLVILFGLSQSEAQGTSLAVLALPVVGFAAMVYYQAGFIRLPIVGIVAAGFLLGAYGGARLLPHISVPFLRQIFGLLLLYVGVIFVLDSRRLSTQAALPAGVAAILSAMALRFFRRKRNASTDSKNSVTEYHI